MTDDKDLGKIMYELVHPENTRVLRWDQYADEYQDQWRKAATDFLAPSNKVIAEMKALLKVARNDYADNARTTNHLKDERYYLEQMHKINQHLEATK